jgi:polysaccharide export outer membrane protein
VVGDVVKSTKMSLSAKSTIMDALIAGGWVKYPVDKMSIQLTRGNQVHTLPLENIIQNPNQQNIALETGDIITALYQPFSFTALGANSKNKEVNFETKGITLAQALARSGGLVANRADVKGIFIFRFEDVHRLKKLSDQPIKMAGDIVPVIYQIDLSNPQSLFAAQRMPIENKDFIYIAEAPSVEFKRFLDIISSTIFSAVNVFRVIQ